jgi:hypothetical protein
VKNLLSRVKRCDRFFTYYLDVAIKKKIFYAAIILFYYCNIVVRTKKGLCHDSISVELGKQLIEVTLFLLEKPENPKLENPLRLSLFLLENLSGSIAIATVLRKFSRHALPRKRPLLPSPSPAHLPLEFFLPPKKKGKGGKRS